MKEKYLEFKIANKYFAYPIERIREIMEYPVVEPLASAPDKVLGVMNLRGKLVVVFDIAACLNEETYQVSSKTCVIVTEVHRGGESFVIANKVDLVRQVVDISLAELETVPNLGGRLESTLIKGVAKLEQRMLTILDVDELLSESQWHCVVHESQMEQTHG
ncbi:chemotaxis protein CheW [Vibrio tubiashii]|uniref:chemotaxis protein CheW n=1 Tax=Vibrio tubiashii TaxID=29498 RepID=UPI003CE474DC